MVGSLKRVKNGGTTYKGPDFR